MKKKLQHRILKTEVTSFFLMLTILLLSLSYVYFIASFDHLFNDKPKIMAEFKDHVWRIRDEIQTTSNHIESIVSSKVMNHPEQIIIGIKNNLNSLSEENRELIVQLDRMSKAVYENENHIFDNYLNTKHLLFVISGLFIAFLVKMLLNIYRYNAYLRTKYQIMLDSIIFSSPNPQENKNEIDLAVFKDIYSLLSSNQESIATTELIIPHSFKGSKINKGIE